MHVLTFMFNCLIKGNKSWNLLTLWAGARDRSQRLARARDQIDRQSRQVEQELKETCNAKLWWADC